VEIAPLLLLRRCPLNQLILQLIVVAVVVENQLILQLNQLILQLIVVAVVVDAAHAPHCCCCCCS